METTEAGGPRGYDAGKKINGRKRHALVDTDGRGLVFQTHPASGQDRDDAPPLLRASRALYPFVEHAFADAGYAADRVATATRIVVEIVRKPAGQVGFAGRKRVRRLMAKMGLAAIYQAPRTTVPHPEHKTYKYLLRDLVIDRPNQVWCADIIYIPMRRGFLYLVAVMDWAKRKVLSWRLSNTMEADFCIEALQEALARYGAPEIFNTDQGSQFTSPRFVEVVQGAGARVSMDGRGRWMDNVFIERLWRSHKHECAYLHSFETGSELRAELARWIGYYNTARLHSAHGGKTPDEAYETALQDIRPAA